MKKVVLVDDEPGVVEGLSVMIDWSEYGFEISGTAEDGLSAFELIKKERPDLVVTDIRMPEMDGLELIKAVREAKSCSPHFLILSGYREFDYARRAMTLGVDDYLLKPIYEESLVEVLKKLSDKFDQEHSEIRDDLDIDKIMMEEDEVPQRLKEIMAAPCIITCGVIDNYILGKHEDVVFAEDRLNRFMTRILKLGTNVGAAQIERDYVMTLLSMDELHKHYGTADAYIKRLISFISSPAGKTVSFVSTGTLNDAEKVKEWWLRFPRLRELLLIDGPAANAGAEELWLRGAVQNAYELQPTPELIHGIADGDNEIIAEIVAKSEQTALSLPLEPSLVLNYIKKLCFEIHRLVTELNGNPSNVDELLLLCQNDLKGVCVRNIFKILENAAISTAGYLKGLDKIRPSTRMRHIQQDLMQSFTKDITIRELASRHGISPAYLGQLFKQEYGESFKDYRNRLRVEEAARLLRKTDLRIYEIAQHVGYHSTDYFERRFQSFYGTTPSAYRAELSGES